MSNEVIKLILDIIRTLAIIVAAVVAVRGINAWRKEFQEKRKIELAEEILALFYEAKDAIFAIRNPFVFVGEGSSRKPQEKETPKQKQARDRAYVVYERYGKWKEVFNKLHSKRYQFMARFGIKEAKSFEDLRQIVIEIQLAANELAVLWCQNPYGAQSQKELKEDIKEQRHIFWCSGKDDSIVFRLEKAISDIEEICRPIIMGKK